jgi:ABC-type polysaccharide/polyol phosphate transport system ATPase subunit
VTKDATDYFLLKVDVLGLNIGIQSNPASLDKKKTTTGAKDILVDSHLKLKSGVRYGLIGRNGTGKSSTCDVNPHSIDKELAREVLTSN